MHGKGHYSMSKDIDILALGTAYVDINCTNFPFTDGLQAETEVAGEQYELAPGGAALNFARVCVGLGLSATFIGKVGVDRMGDIATDSITKSGVTPRLIRDPKALTNLSLNLVNDQGKSVMAVVGNAKHRFTAEEMWQELEPLLPRAKYVILGGAFKLENLRPIFKQIAKVAGQNDTKLVFDHGRFAIRASEADRTILREFATLADYYLPSRDEFLALWGVDTIAAGLELFNNSTTTVVVKDSAHGAHTLMGSTCVTIPAFRAQVVNTVGAGDSFNAGLISALDTGLSMTDAIRFACATAALKISQSDPITTAMVQHFLNKQG